MPAPREINCALLVDRFIQEGEERYSLIVHVFLLSFLFKIFLSCRQSFHRGRPQCPPCRHIQQARRGRTLHVKCHESVRDVHRLWDKSGTPGLFGDVVSADEVEGNVLGAGKR